jgi:hypothetical protein
MPLFQVAIGHLNCMFGNPDFLRRNRTDLLDLYRPSEGPEGTPDRLVETTRLMLSDQSPFGEGLKDVDIGRIARLVAQQPPTILEAERAVVYRNLQRDRPYGMTFAWAPGYDYEVTVWESPPTEASPGWITVLIKTRYPNDPHPGTNSPMDAG